MKNSGENSTYLLAQYKIEAPDLWWALDPDAPTAVWFGAPAKDLEALHIVSPNAFDVVFEILDDDETLDAFYEVRNISKWRTLFTLTKQVKLSPESHAIVQKLKESPSLEKPGALAMLDAPIQEWKNLYSYSWVTSAFWAEMRRCHAELDQFAFDILNRLLWRIGVHCGPSSLASEFLEMRYSVDGEKFEELPVRMDFKAESVPPKEKETKNPKLQMAANFLELDDKNEAPIHHLLFREAWKCHESEKRVSIVMATAAAEAAVKNLIGTLMPNTTWLLENTQSPPVVKIVEELFPKLPVKCSFNGVVLSPPETLVEMLKRIITSRNKIVHGSPPAMPTDKELEKWLLAVRDLLWLSDYYNGYDWALEHISAASLQELKARAKEN
ncbi:MAG: hypothetical protein ACLQAH_01050 [Limisphaerales bacterium]